MLVSPGVLQAPLHHLETAKAHSHSLINSVLLLHAVIQDEMWYECSPDPVPTATVEEHGPTTSSAQHFQDLFDGLIVEGPCPYRNIDVFHPELADHRRFVYGAILHRVADIEYDLTTGVLQRTKLRRIRLASGDYLGQDLTGIGDTADGFERSRHFSGVKVRSTALRLVGAVHDHAGAFQGDQPSPNHCVQLWKDRLDFFLAIHALDDKREIER
jgi:hypothetical protein